MIELLNKQVMVGEHLLSSDPFDGQAYLSWQDSCHDLLDHCFGVQDGASARFSALHTSALFGFGLLTNNGHKDCLKRQISFLNVCRSIISDKMPIQSATQESPEERIRRTSIGKDPLLRRYQVFVSSTYEDLKEERKHVMQALLETMCIPTGMEHFPASSTDQMTLIKRIIDDCDYYVIIVAGRYGSLGPDGLSFTEMEFDYAVASEKSVLAFFHADIKSLVGGKLEDSDSGRQQLAKFTAKLKTARVCKPWSTADGLASSIKSAILHAILHDPKPGWIRGNVA